MIQSVFVAPDGRPHGRWLEAFPGAHVVSSLKQALRQRQADGLLWCLGQRLTALRAALEAEPDLRWVALSLKPDADEARAAFEAGAQGYCHALAAPGMLRDVAIVVRHGGMWIGRELMGSTVRNATRMAPQIADPGAWDGLTAREREVARWIVQGASNREIAQQLAISERTVKAHLAAMFDKLQVRDRLQLAVHLGSPPDAG